MEPPYAHFGYQADVFVLEVTCWVETYEISLCGNVAFDMANWGEMKKNSPRKPKSLLIIIVSNFSAS